MKKALLNALFSFLILLGVNALVACTQNGNSPLAPPGTEPGKITSNGTSDTGGGTGFDGKVFESYKVNPAELAAFKEILKPLLENIENDSSSQLVHFANILKMKTWYIAPVELQKIDKDVLGVSFIRTDTEQIALQTSTAIWIKKSTFEAMSRQEQADLILHELVMNIYFLKFAKMSNICKAISFNISAQQVNKCEEDGPALDALRPAEDSRPLNSKDYASIQFVTAWMLQNLTGSKKVARGLVNRIFLENNFDARLFSEYSSDEANSLPKEQIQSSELVAALVAAQAGGSLPDLCNGIKTGQKKSCRLEIASDEIMTVRGVRIVLKIDNQKIVDSFMPLNSKSMELPAYKDEFGKKILMPFTHMAMNPKTGDRLHSGYIVLKKESEALQSALAVDTVIIIPGIVVSAEKDRQPVCVLQRPEADTFERDVLLIQRKGASESFKVRSLLTTAPFGACVAL